MVHSGPCKVSEESKAEAERTDFPQSGQKRPQGDGERKGLYPRMAWLFLHCEYAYNNAKMGRMAAPSVSDVYLETMEAAEDESKESDEARTPGMACLRSCLFPKIILEKRRTRKCADGYIQQKTRTGRILQYPGPVRVSALMRSNRRVPNGTHGGVRGRG